MAPNLQVDRLLYTPYGIGLPTLMVTVLITGFTYKTLHERVLSWGCAVILTIPFFTWVLNGGLYIREKALIPFLPLLCYLLACYVKKLENERVSFASVCIPFGLTIGLLYAGQEASEFSKYGTLFLLDAVIMAGSFLLFWWKKEVMLILVPPVVFLVLFGTVFHEQADRIESREFYEKVTDPAVDQVIAEILDEDTGFYRLEQVGGEDGNAANLNRIRNMGQYISSIYSSSYNQEYQEFRKHTFGVEEPFRNDLMQSVSRNPLFLKLMGVRYLVSEKEIPGYELVRAVGDIRIYKNEEAIPVAYVTDRLISEKAYDALEFPYNQMALAYGVVESGEHGDMGIGAAEKKGRQILEEMFQALEPAEIVLPEQKTDSFCITRKGEGYRIRAKKKGMLQIELSGFQDGEAVKGDRILFLQFAVKNNRPPQDVTVWLEGERNKLTARDHIYYNGNTTFSFAAVLEEGDTSAELTLGKGDYEITDVVCFLGSWGKQAAGGQGGRLYQSEFYVDKEKTGGNVIAGFVDVEKAGYFVTSIPYDPNFEILVDGKAAEYEKVNTAFLGFPIRKGSHTVEMTYHAPGRQAGVWCSVAGAVLFCIALIKELLRNMERAWGR